VWHYSNRLAPAAADHAYVVGHAVDVTAQLAQTEELRELSERDALTGCYNRRYLDDFDQRQPAGQSWGVINIDLDHFKQVNDRLGHEAGDQVLIGVARFLQARARKQDAVIRVGGDEFLLLLPGADADAVNALVDRLQQDAALAPTAFSLGWAARQHAEPLAQTLARADQAMFASRAAVRGISAGRGPADPAA
jgi:diguanylate cyclase (GGDEF)-like protein